MLKYKRNQVGKRNLGSVTVAAEERKRGSQNVFNFEFEAEGFRNCRHLFYRLYRNKELDGDYYLPVFESEAQKMTPQGTFHFKLSEIWAHTLIRDNFDRMVQMQVFEW